MPITDLESLASYLALEWDLTECEADDVLNVGVVLAAWEGCTEEGVRLHMEVRAEVLKLVGSEMEEMYRYFTGKERLA